MKTAKNKTPNITLPAFLRRVLKSSVLKSLIREQGGELNRIGRSRNWQLNASFEQIEAIITAIEASEEQSWQWLVTHLSKGGCDTRSTSVTLTPCICHTPEMHNLHISFTVNYYSFVK